jgi:hypothetical protein
MRILKDSIRFQADQSQSSTPGSDDSGIKEPSDTETPPSSPPAQGSSDPLYDRQMRLLISLRSGDCCRGCGMGLGL